MNSPQGSPVAMISGASRGIGAAIADKLLSEGWRVSLGVRQPESCPRRDGAIACRFDALDPDDDARWVQETVDHFGRIDALVHNAGIMIQKTVLKADGDDFDRLFGVNVKSPMLLTQKAWPYLKQAPAGKIVVIASLSGKRVKSAGSSFYALSKYAAVALAAGLRQCGKNDGIRATAICPSYVATDMGNALAHVEPSELTQPEDIAEIVAMVLALPKRASIAEVPVHWSVEDCY